MDSSWRPLRSWRFIGFVRLSKHSAFCSGRNQCFAVQVVNALCFAPSASRFTLAIKAVSRAGTRNSQYFCNEVMGPLSLLQIGRRFSSTSYAIPSREPSLQNCLDHGDLAILLQKIHGLGLQITHQDE
jgi:hypothetical protein